MNDPSVEESINTLLLLCGEYGHIMSFLFCSAEGSGLYQDMNRCEMLDKHVDKSPTRNYEQRNKNNPYDRLHHPRVNSRIDRVEYAYSDVCCEGLNDIKSHWFCHL